MPVAYYTLIHNRGIKPMLDLEKEPRKITRSFSMKPSSLQMLQDIAEKHNTNSSKVVEAMIVQFGPQLLKQ